MGTDRVVKRYPLVCPRSKADPIRVKVRFGRGPGLRNGVVLCDLDLPGAPAYGERDMIAGMIDDRLDEAWVRLCQ
jgi:hypothetical protein